MSAANAHAQVQRGAIRGVVNDSAGRPIVGVQLTVKNTDLRTTTGIDGRYVLPGVWPGETKVVAQRIGFQLQSTTIDVKAADTTHADFVMPSLAYVDDVVTTAEGTSARMEAFEQRRARGGGAFITRAEIERRHPAKMSDMLRTVAGVSIKSNTTAGEQTNVTMERSSHSIGTNTCEVQYYVDGHPYPRGNIDDFPPETIEGIEIFRGGSELPAEYRAQNSGCGLIGVWTRDPSLIPRKP
jgi:outer membrane receptor for Fe3+-dicitrate